MHKIYLFLVSVLCLFSLIYITTPETKAERQDKGKSRILKLIENEESAILAKKTPGVSLSSQEISEIFVPVLIYTNDKNDTKSILDSGSIEKYKVFEHIDFVYAHINKSTLDALDLNSNTIFLFEDEIFDAPEPTFSTETIQPTTTLSSTYTGKGNVVAIIDTGIKEHPFITDSDVTALDGSSVPRIVYQECHSGTGSFNSNGSHFVYRSLCEDTDGDGDGEDVVTDQSLNPAMNCDASLASDCSHGLNVASTISGEKPTGETASTPSPSAPDTQLAIYKITRGILCDNNNTADPACEATEAVAISVSGIMNSINSIIGRKKEYLNGDTDGDAGLNIVSVNMSLGSAVDYTSVECTNGMTYSYIFIGPLIYSTDTSKDTLHKYNVAMVTSAGNEGQKNGEALFGCLPGALSVAALNSSVNNPEVASFSNIAPYTDFIDEGQSVRVAAISGGYGSTSGTSFSSPKVAGIYSALAQKYPDATIDELTKRLKTFATFFADTRTDAVNTTAKFPQPNIEEALSGEPIISRSQIKDISTAYDEASNTYSTIEDSLDIEFVSDTSRAYITSASGGHFTGEIDVTAATDPINGVSVFSITVPITDSITDTIFINTVDDLTTNSDIISTNLFIIENTIPTVFVEAIDTNTQISDFDINVTFSKEVNNVDIGDFRLVSKDVDTSTAPTLGTIVVQKHSNSNFNDTSPTITDTTTTQLSGTYFKVKVSPQDDLMTDDGTTEYAFQVIDDAANSSSIVDGASSTLGAQGLSGIIRATADINIDTAHPKTESISLVTSGTQTSTFDVKVSFTETVNNVSVDNFDFTDGSTSVASITKVELHSDSDFNDQSPSTTTDSTTLSGRYFKISINTNNDVNGTYTFKVLPTSITDENGNTFQTSTDDTFNVVVDTTPPVFTITISPETSVSSKSKTVTLAHTNTEVSVTYSYLFTTDSDSSTCEATDDSLFVNTISGSTFTLDEETQNNNYICIRAIDQAGNATKQLSIKIENIDTTSPTFNITVSDTTPATSKEVTITPTSTGETTVTYSSFLTTDSSSATCAASDDSLFTDSITNLSVTLTKETNNGNYICIRAIDQAGNITKQISTSAIGGIDTTPPVFTITISPETSVSSKSKTVTLTNTNTETSVAYSYLFTTESDSATCAASDDSLFVNTISGSTFTLDEETQNNNYICIRAVDQAGNITKQLSIKIENIDTTSPTFNITVSDTTPATSKEVTITPTSTGETTVTYSSFLTTDSSSATCAASDDSLFTDSITNLSITLTKETNNGNYICIRAIDQAGNITKQISTSAIGGIDTTLPVFTIAISPETSVPSQSKTVTLTNTNTETSVAYSYLFTTESDSATCAAIDDSLFVNTISGSAFTLDEESNNDNYICIRAVDQAGNETKQLSIKIENIDTTLPIIRDTKRDSDYQITITTSETLVGVTEINVSTISGGFTITNSDGTTTLRPKTIEVTNNTIILKFDDTSTTVLTNNGTYIYTPYATTAIAISDNAGNGLASFDSANSEAFISFTLDTDESGGYTASQDGLFLYLYTQTAKPLADSALELFIDSNSSLEDTKDNIDEGVTTNFLDLDGSGGYTASQDGLFLYLYTQTAKPLADSALELFIDSSSSLEDTKGNVAKLLP